MNIELDYAIKAIEAVFEKDNIGDATAQIYLKDKSLCSAKPTTRRGFLNACKKLDERFGVPINTS